MPAAVYGGYGSAPLPVDDFLATFGARGDRDVSALLPPPLHQHWRASTRCWVCRGSARRCVGTPGCTGVTGIRAS